MKAYKTGDYIDDMDINITEAEEKKFNEILEKKQRRDAGQKKFCAAIRKYKDLVYQVLDLDDDMQLVRLLKELSMDYGVDPRDLLKWFGQEKQKNYYLKVHPDFMDQQNE